MTPFFNLRKARWCGSETLPVVLLQAGGLNGAHLQYASIVDQDVQPVEVIQHFPQDGGAVLLPAHIRHNQ